MIVPKHKINAFLNQPREDLHRYKRFSKAKLIRMKERLPVTPPIWKPLSQHQRVGFLASAKYKRLGLWFDTGTGKTFMSIAIGRYLRKLGNNKHFLVLVPAKTNCTEWGKQFRKHSPNTSFKILHGSSKQKWEQLRDNPTLFTVTTYGGLMRMVCELQKASKRGRGRKKKNHLVPSKELVKEMVSHFDGLFMDESTMVGSHQSLYFRICRQISKKATAVFALSGTPFGKDPTPLWAQMYLVDKGETLGKTLGMMRAAFYSSKINSFSGFPEYTFMKRKQKEFRRFLRHRSIRYKANDADLPRAIPIPVDVRLPKDARSYFEEVRKLLISSHGNYRENKNAYLRARQISSGFLGYFDDEQGVKAKFEFPTNPKLEALINKIEFTNPEDKIVVFHEYIYSGDVISKALKKAKIGYVRIKAGQKDDSAERDKFDNDPNCKVLVLSNSIGAYGLNLQVAQYLMYYETPKSFILWKQTMARVQRQYSKHKKVFIYYFIVKGTYDQKILDALKEGKNFFKMIMEGKRRKHKLDPARRKKKKQVGTWRKAEKPREKRKAPRRA